MVAINMNVSSKHIALTMEKLILDGQDPTVDEVAEIIGWSRTSWADQFQRDMNATPGYYMRMFRIRCIIQNLRNTPRGYSVANIASDYGRTQPHLTRDFKAIIGVTPGNYRAMGELDAQHMRDRAFAGISFMHSFNTIPPTAKEIF